MLEYIYIYLYSALYIFIYRLLLYSSLYKREPLIKYPNGKEKQNRKTEHFPPGRSVKSPSAALFEEKSTMKRYETLIE